MAFASINACSDRHAGLAGMPESILDGLGDAVTRLQDPYNYDHTTLPDMLKTYKARNLEKSKLYRLAKSIFGDRMDPKAKHRTRVFVLEGNARPQRGPKFDEDPVRGAGRPDSAADFAAVSQCDAWSLGAVQPPASLAAGKDSRDPRAAEQAASGVVSSQQQEQQQQQQQQQEIEEYDRWIAERKQLRRDLDELGLSEHWLVNKPMLTDIEAGLLKKMKAAKRELRLLKATSQKPPANDEELPPRPPVASNVPLIRRPSPLALRTLESYLAANKLRLLDLFAAIDKQKAWKVSKEDFIRALKEHEIRISDSLLNDLIMTLDANEEGMLNYKDLAKGMSIWRIEKRESKSRAELDGDMIEEDDDGGESSARSRTPHVVVSAAPSSAMSSVRLQRSRSGVSSAVSSSTALLQLLEPPAPDTRDECYVMGSAEEQVDARKRDMAAHSLRKRLEMTSEGGHRTPSSSSLRRRSSRSLGRGSSSSGSSGSHHPSPAPALVPVGGVFKTGYRPVDEHCRSSSLDVATAERTDRFRQLKLKEYYEILNLCQKRGVSMGRDLLDRVLLHPGDKPSRILLKQGVRQAGAELHLSRHFADPPKRPRTPIEIRNKHKMKRNEKGELLIDYRHQFPPGASVNCKPERTVLSTGKAYVNRKVDCWMTFEEYENLVSEYKTRYVRLRGETNEDAFWPGKLLEKMRLVLDGDRTSEPANAVFHHVRKETRHNYGCDNDLNNWPVSDAGYLVQGSLRHPKT